MLYHETDLLYHHDICFASSKTSNDEWLGGIRIISHQIFYIKICSKHDGLQLSYNNLMRTLIEPNHLCNHLMQTKGGYACDTISMTDAGVVDYESR